MRIITAKSLRIRLIYLPALILLIASLAHASTPTKTFESGKKGKVTGTIVSRNGDLVIINVKKESTSAIVNLTDNTKIEREKSFRLRRADMDVTAMVPGLTIEAEGVGGRQLVAGGYGSARQPSATPLLIARQAHDRNGGGRNRLAREPARGVSTQAA